MLGIPKLRVARPSDDLEALLPFYCDGLGLSVLYRFEDHNGFDGIMFGATEAPYHFEFTRARARVAGKAPTEENLLVFYFPVREEWQAAVARMREAGFAPVRSSILIGGKMVSPSRIPTATRSCFKTPAGDYSRAAFTGSSFDSSARSAFRTAAKNRQ